MKRKYLVSSFFAVVLFLALAPAALARTWYVDGVNGNDNNDCKTPQTACKTIGHAISLCSSGDTIRVAPATYTENLTINFSLRIIGSDAATTIVDGGGVASVFTISSTTANVTLSKLTIRNGYNGDYGGGMYNYGTLTVNRSTITANSSNYGGGGISNGGTLTINNSTISRNTPSPGYGIGGGIVNWSALTVNRSTIAANSASAGGGGILSQGSTVTINNSTVSGNSAGFSAGGIEIASGTATINNSTVSGNSATYGGGIYQFPYYGASVTLQNSIVANNSGGNCNGTMTSDGYNLSDDNTCNFNGPGDMNNTKAKLAALGNYGGPTQTIKEFLHSPTVDAGNPNGCTDSRGHLLTTDQRGDPRPGKYKQDQRCDMGAYERQRDRCE